MTTTCFLMRDDFPMLKKKVNGQPLIYFDSAATAQKPQCVIDAISDFYTESYATVHRGAYQLSKESTQQFLQARQSVQKFLNAECSEEIIFTRGATAALNLVARSFGSTLQAGDVILVSEIEHHSNLVPWQMVCAEKGAQLKIIPVNDRGELDLDALETLLDGSVKLVSIAHVSHVLGTIHPVGDIIKSAHAQGALVCIDGAQAAPHLPIDLQELDADFYVFSGHKLYGPTGIGVLYGKKELLEAMPPIEGGGDMIEQVFLDRTTYAPLPLKFEAGTPMIAEAIGLKAAIDYLTFIGIHHIQAWEQELHDYALGKLQQIDGLNILGQAREKGAIITFTVDGVHPLDLATLLDCRGVALRTGHLCSQPALRKFDLSSVNRISFGLYNTLEEIDHFVNHLILCLKFLRLN